MILHFLHYSTCRSPIAHRPPQDEVAQRYASLPPHLESALLPFQREGVRFGLERGGRCLIADEMGVGKTVQAIALAACYRCDSWPLLVVCPASLRLVWAEELEKWLPDLPPGSIHIINDKTDRVQPDEGAPHRGLPAVTITSYRMLEHLCCGVCKCDRAFKQRVGEAKKAVKEGLMLRPCMDLRACMASFGWRMLIVDESHTLRTTGAPFDAQHTEAVWAVGRGATRIVLLSGTPSLSKPFDLFRQIDVLRPGLLGKDKFEFSANYCNRRVVPCYPYHEYSKRWDNSGLTRAGELHLLLREEVMVRRLKRDVLDQLPPKRRQIIRLQKPKASEWPKEGTQGRHRADDSDAEDGDEDEGEGGEQLPGDGAATAEAWASAPPRRMSAAHRTGIAKCRDAAEWLVAQLGLESGAGEDAGEGDGEDTGADGDADLGNDGGGSAGTSADGGGPSKFIVFAHHRSVMNRLAATLDEALSMKNGRQRFYFVRIDGETDQQSRREAVERFRSDASVRVALLSVTAAGTGLDFSAASAVVFVGALQRHERVYRLNVVGPHALFDVT